MFGDGYLMLRSGFHLRDPLLFTFGLTWLGSLIMTLVLMLKWHPRVKWLGNTLKISLYVAQAFLPVPIDLLIWIVPPASLSILLLCCALLMAQRFKAREGTTV